MKKFTEQHLKTLERAVSSFKLKARRSSEPNVSRQFMHDARTLQSIIKIIEDASREPMFDNLVEAFCELSI